jgi:hypothetical protein
MNLKLYIYIYTKVTFLQSGRDIRPFLLSGQDVASATFLEFQPFQRHRRVLVTGQTTDNAGYSFKVGVTEAHAKRIMHQLAVRTAVGTLRTKIA